MESVKSLTENGSWKVLLEKKTEKIIESVGGNSNLKIEVLKMFALKFFSENKHKTESRIRIGNWQSLCAQVDVKNRGLTAVSHNGWFFFLRPKLLKR